MVEWSSDSDIESHDASANSCTLEMKSIPWAACRNVYVHFPLCARRCSYCDFNITTDETSWRNAYVSRIASDYADLNQRPELSSLYIGGGTPSLMTAAEIENTVSIFNLSSETEVTVEVNPSENNRVGFCDMRAAGVTRLSVGIQSLNDFTLAAMQRDHTGREALRVLEEASRVFGRDRVSFDLILGLPNIWNDDKNGLSLEAQIDLLAPFTGHCSVYELEVGPQLKRRHLDRASEDARVEEFNRTCAHLESVGFARYEVSNFARNRNSRARHNSNIWAGETYAGLGPGAHGRLKSMDGTVYETVGTPDARRWSLGDTGRCQLLSEKDRMRELVALGLRTVDGVAMAPVAAVLDSDAIETLVQANLLRVENGRLWANGHGGLDLLDSILPRIIAE